MEVPLTTNVEVPRPRPGTPANAGGTATIMVERMGDATQMNYRIAFRNLSGPLNAAHFHRAVPGQAGPVVHAICAPNMPARQGATGGSAMTPAASPTPATGTLTRGNPSPSPAPGAQAAPAAMTGGRCPQTRTGTLAGVWRMTQAELEDWRAGRLYVNLHTQLNPQGEVRGNLPALHMDMAPISPRTGPSPATPQRP